MKGGGATMQQQEIHNFLERYFHANNVKLLKINHGYMTCSIND